MGTNRRTFIKQSALSAAGLGGGMTSFGMNHTPGIKTTESSADPGKGKQRLSIEDLEKWKSLEYGMFIHYGMSTFTGMELDTGNSPSSIYDPSKLDVDQWISVARDAGMKYAVLTTKHVAGHCLWPSKYNEYHVGNSGNKTDVVEAFVKACQKYRIMPGFYYCSWDNHNLYGSETWSKVGMENMYTTQKYRDFQLNQVEELLTHYGKIGEVWIDIPGALGFEGRKVQYDQIASLQPETLIMLNNGMGNGSWLKYSYTWPTDLMAIERYLPSSTGYNPWFKIPVSATEKEDYYIPGEVCDPIGKEWFWKDEDILRPVNELLGMRMICKSRGTNFLLDVPPDRSGQIPKATIDRLMQLEKKFSQLGG
jgi:alpha-L-fucosidase